VKNIEALPQIEDVAVLTRIARGIFGPEIVNMGVPHGHVWQVIAEEMVMIQSKTGLEEIVEHESMTNLFFSWSSAPASFYFRLKYCPTIACG
jgi:hypothetical protein